MSIVADIATITGISTAAVLGLLRKNKSLTGFKVNAFVIKVFRIGMIIIASILLFRYLQPIYEILLIIIKSNNLNLFWENGKEIQYLLAYFITGAIGLFFFWLLVPIIWTSSFAYAIELINLLLPKSLKINTMKFRNEIIFRIDKAVYGKDDKIIDVTDKLQQMVKNNSLEINASNSLAGDPFVGVMKDLIIDYTINGVAKREIIKEGNTKIIPS
jgi:hypothetical protein